MIEKKHFFEINKIILGYYALLLIVLFYISFFFVPDLWGVNNIYYYSVEIKSGLFLIFIFLIITGINGSLFRYLNTIETLLFEHRKKNFYRSVFLILLFLFFFLFKVNTLVFGDSNLIINKYSTGKLSSADINKYLFGFSFSDILQQEGALPMIINYYISDIFKIGIIDTYRITSALWGIIYAVICFYMASKLNKRMQLIFLIVCILSGSSQIFFGHAEVYPSVFVLLLIFLLYVTEMLSDNKSILISLLLFLFLLKFHLSAIIYIPAFGYALYQKSRKAKSSYNIKKDFSFIISLLFVIITGFAVYFFLFKSYTNASTGTPEEFQKLFLPVLGYPNSEKYYYLNNYLLFGINHLRDFLNIFLLVSLPPLLISIIAFYSLLLKKFKFSNVTKYSLITIISSFLFFFTLNPSLSAVRDWDLYTLTIPPLIIFIYSFLKQKKDINEQSIKKLFPIIIILVILNVLSFLANNSQSMLFKKLENLTIYNYKTYNKHTNKLFSAVINSAGNYNEIQTAVSRMLNSFNNYGIIDTIEYDEILNNAFEVYLQKKNYAGMKEILDKKYKINPSDTTVLYNVMHVNGYLGLHSDTYDKIRTSLKILKNNRNVFYNCIDYALSNGDTATAKEIFNEFRNDHGLKDFKELKELLRNETINK